MEFTKKEITYLLVASIIAGFVFSFDEWGTEVFNLSAGLINLLKAVILVLIIYTVHTFSQKLIAKKSSCDLEFDLITTEKIPLTHIIISKGFKFTGPLITLIFSLVSNGKLIFETNENIKVINGPVNLKPLGIIIWVNGIFSVVIKSNSKSQLDFFAINF